MGKPAGRLGDIGSNHGAYPPTPITSGSSDVLINGKPAARVGDSLAPHKKPKSPMHGRTIASGSSSVFINGKPAATVGSSISCGGTVIIGSGNVSIGDSPVLMKPTDTSISLTRPTQTGRDGQSGKVPYQPGAMSSGEKVMIDHETTETEELEPEFKNATIRLAINPANNLFGSDKFILSSTDGSISITKTVADDLIPGDDYLDLLFENLDTSLNYKLEQIDGSSGDSYTYFKSFSYGALGVQSRPADDEDDEESDTQ